MRHLPCENSSLHKIMPSKKRDINSKRVSTYGPKKLFDPSDLLHNVTYKYHIYKAKILTGDRGSFHLFFFLCSFPPEPIELQAAADSFVK